MPSASGMAPIECIDDTDRNGVFKITDKDHQKLAIIQAGSGRKHTQLLDLSGLTLSGTGV